MHFTKKRNDYSSKSMAIGSPLKSVSLHLAEQQSRGLVIVPQGPASCMHACRHCARSSSLALVAWKPPFHSTWDQGTSMAARMLSPGRCPGLCPCKDLTSQMGKDLHRFVNSWRFAWITLSFYFYKFTATASSFSKHLSCDLEDHCSLLF